MIQDLRSRIQDLGFRISGSQVLFKIHCAHHGPVQDTLCTPWAGNCVTLSSSVKLNLYTPWEDNCITRSSTVQEKLRTPWADSYVTFSSSGQDKLCTPWADNYVTLSSSVKLKLYTPPADNCVTRGIEDLRFRIQGLGIGLEVRIQDLEFSIQDFKPRI